MKRIALVLLLVPGLANAERKIEGDKKVDIDCGKDPDVAIHSGDGVFTFTGTCDKITVNGGGNKLAIASVKKLTVVGANNTINTDKGGAMIERVSVTGSKNKVFYKGTKPKIASIGTGNEFNQTK